jgi:hypothetical protein
MNRDGTPTRFDREDEQWLHADQDIHLMKHPELWPLRHVLPLKRLGEDGCLVTEKRVIQEGHPEPAQPPLPKATVWPITGHILLTGCTCSTQGRAARAGDPPFLPLEEYPSLEALVAAGWRVD